MEKLVKIECKEIVNKEKGNKFIVYKAQTNKGRLINCKFGKGVVKPTELGVYYLSINTPDMFISEDKNGYKVLWINNYNKIAKQETISCLTAKKVAKVDDLFDDVSEDLPF